MTVARQPEMYICEKCDEPSLKVYRLAAKFIICKACANHYWTIAIKKLVENEMLNCNIEYINLDKYDDRH